MSVEIKTIDSKAHQYADNCHYRPHYSQWLRALVDYKEGYQQAIKDFKISEIDDERRCHGTSMNRIETLEWKKKDLEERLERQSNTISELYAKLKEL